MRRKWNASRPCFWNVPSWTDLSSISQFSKEYEDVPTQSITCGPKSKTLHYMVPVWLVCTTRHVNHLRSFMLGYPGLVEFVWEQSGRPFLKAVYKKKHIRVQAAAAVEVFTSAKSGSYGAEMQFDLERAQKEQNPPAQQGVVGLVLLSFRRSHTQPRECLIMFDFFV